MAVVVGTALLMTVTLMFLANGSREAASQTPRIIPLTFITPDPLAQTATAVRTNATATVLALTATSTPLSTDELILPATAVHVNETQTAAATPDDLLLMSTAIRLHATQTELAFQTLTAAP